MECYIEYLDASNGFKVTRKEFKTYEEAKQWMFNNIEKPNIDMIKFY